MKHLTQRQKNLSRQIKEKLNESDILDDAMCDSCAMLITTIEECTKVINEQGVLITQKGSRGQDVTKENPAINTRIVAIKQLNVITRTLKLDKKGVVEVNELTQFMNGNS
ncbi:P27 family phage terminase small subunit [Vibrio splendidus]